MVGIGESENLFITTIYYCDSVSPSSACSSSGSVSRSIIAFIGRILLELARGL